MTAKFEGSEINDDVYICFFMHVCIFVYPVPISCCNNNWRGGGGYNQIEIDEKERNQTMKQNWILTIGVGHLDEDDDDDDDVLYTISSFVTENAICHRKLKSMQNFDDQKCENYR